MRDAKGFLSVSRDEEKISSGYVENKKNTAKWKCNLVISTKLKM